ncbi:beta-galactosidase GalB [Marinoscillum sp.]|uniref:beta-galactosidase GalB n=1 Tax=Marinoscillum sp. TaxID=2024838 RepID=UPI003BABEB95
MKRIEKLLGLFLLATLTMSCQKKSEPRKVENFNGGWRFRLSDSEPTPDQKWRTVDLPHDWSIAGDFDPSNPSGVGGGALPGGVGWYKKSFVLGEEYRDRKVFVQFDGIYQMSRVWLNGELLGFRPNGYISFEYDLTPFLRFDAENEILVKVDNGQQPNSRWYSGSGIYRNVRLVTTGPVYVPQYGTYVVTPEVSVNQAEVVVTTTITNQSEGDQNIQLITSLVDVNGNEVGLSKSTLSVPQGVLAEERQQMVIETPRLWSLESPELYKAITTITSDGKVLDVYETLFGIRFFDFDPQEGFSLNGVSTKIKGVCLHHDLGALGAAFNKRAMERQLRIMQEMGVNAIRTSHNPPAPEVLQLCDEMGLLVMDEMFDMWAIGKTEHDYSQYWTDWHERDLRDFIRRDRNHPSIIVWSIGNEIMEQYNHTDSTGGLIARELAAMVRSLDSRPITTANNDTSPDNPLIRYGGLDLVGFNYHHEQYEDFPENFPNQVFIATETNSSLATRGHYDMPSDSVRIWPLAWDKKFESGNPENTVSAYDHVRTPWGSTQEDTWRIIKKNDFMSGMFIWTGFDYLGEPTPYEWPSRSSYFGLVDLAGFPKDSYYMYQSEWTDQPMLHVFPPWTMPSDRNDELVDVWAYYNEADEVELFLNGKSLGAKSKENDEFHVMWRVPYQPGELKAISRKDGNEVLTVIDQTAGEPARIELLADQRTIKANGTDLSFVTVKVLDEKGTLVPYADNLISFELEGPGKIVGVDNGNPVSHEPFQASYRKAFHGLCLVVVQSNESPGDIVLQASADGLEGVSINITTVR